MTCASLSSEFAAAEEPDPERPQYKVIRNEEDWSRLKDPARLFNSSLEGNIRRAIDIHEGEKINEAALKALIQAAVALNLKNDKSKSKSKAAPAKSKRRS